MLIRADPRAISELQVRRSHPRSRCRPALDRVSLRHRDVARSIFVPALLTHRCTPLQMAQLQMGPPQMETPQMGTPQT